MACLVLDLRVQALPRGRRDPRTQPPSHSGHSGHRIPCSLLRGVRGQEFQSAVLAGLACARGVEGAGA
jgi:hypothetical protein